MSITTTEWAGVVRSTFESAGFSVEGLPDSLTAQQAEAFLQECIRKLKERNAR